MLFREIILFLSVAAAVLTGCASNPPGPLAHRETISEPVLAKTDYSNYLNCLGYEITLSSVDVTEVIIRDIVDKTISEYSHGGALATRAGGDWGVIVKSGVQALNQAAT